eukprot:PhF_6_TR37183/c0_g1_i1/m.54774
MCGSRRIPVCVVLFVVVISTYVYHVNFRPSMRRHFLSEATPNNRDDLEEEEDQNTDESTHSSVANTTNMFCSRQALFMKKKEDGAVKFGCARRVKGGTCRLCVSRNVTQVVIEIGTNIDPNYAEFAQDNKDFLYMAVEPIPDHYKTMVKVATSGPKGLQPNRFIAVPAVVAPGDGFTVFNLAKSPACSSMLEMNHKRTIGKCATLDKRLAVPKVTLDSLISLIPRHLPISLLSIDAQGFDLVVASTLTLASYKVTKRVRIMVLECQDLPHIDNKQRWLYQGSFNCDTIRHCMEESPRWGGFVLEACVNNHPKRDVFGVTFAEFNCFYRRTFVPSSEVERFQNCSAPYSNCRKKFLHEGDECPYL